MASYNLTATQVFPEGTSIGAYPASGWPTGTAPPARGSAPLVAASQTATMTSGVASFTGLADNTQYFFGAQVAGEWRYVSGTTPKITAGLSTAGIADREPVVWDAASQSLVPFDKPAVKTGPSGATQMYLPYVAPKTGWAGSTAIRPVHLETAWDALDVDIPGSTPVNIDQGVTSTVNYGVDGAGTIVPATIGTVHALSARYIVKASGNARNEHAPLFAFLRYENGAVGRAWLADWNVHGPVGAQPNRLAGWTMFLNNYYNGSPSNEPSAAAWIVSMQGIGGGGAAEHTAATSYPNDVGLGIIGTSGPAGGRTQGWRTALRIGGGGTWGIADAAGSSRIGTAIDLSDWEGYGLYVRAAYGGTPSPKAIIVAPNAGSVGIGIDPPSAQLHVRRPTNGGIVQHIDSADGSSTYDAFLVAQGRARFGYDAAIGRVALDDNGVARALAIRTNATERIRFGAAGELGFFNTAGVAKQAVSGSRAGNAALASLLTALAAHGLLTDSSTA